MAGAEPDSPSLEATQTTTGRPLRWWALAAIVTLLSVMPAAILLSVLPVQGAMTNRSRSFLGPMGSASKTEEMTRRPQMRSISRIRSWAVPNRVSVTETISDTMGITCSYRAATCSRAASARLWVQKESYAKLTGRGLGNYLKETDFDPADIQIIDGCYVAIMEEGE